MALKVISGDNPRTVARGRARGSGSPDAERAATTPASCPRTSDELAEVLEQHSVFGRVTPQQKRAMVGALQSKGHVVAMTGDGVNDALALKDADIGVAMGSGAAATRAVAQLVLLDGKFATMPGVVAEGRRVIANIERSANLFVTKTVYAMLLAIAVVIAGWRVPVPAAPPHDRQHLHDRHPGLLPRARAEHAAVHPRLHRAGAAVHASRPGIVAAAAAAARATASRGTATTSRCASRARPPTLVLIAVGLWVLVLQARPFNWWKTVLVASMVGAVAVILVVPALRDFYALQLPPADVAVEAAIVAGVAIVLLEVGWRFSRVIGQPPQLRRGRRRRPRRRGSAGERAELQPVLALELR